MLTDVQIDHYRTFGFVLLRGHLDSETIAALSDEIDRAFRDAFGSYFEERPTEEGGITGHYLPVMSVERTPASVGLVERLVPVAEQLIGPLALPSPAEAVLFFEQAGLHTDSGFAVPGAKFAVYLEPLTAATGALRVLPGSHHQPYGELAQRHEWGYAPSNAEELCRAIESIPMVPLETEPADVIVFNEHLLHASIHGRERRQWNVTYYPAPATPEQTEAIRGILLDHVHEGYGSWGHYDPARYPFYDPAWLDPDKPFVARMRAIGALRR